jgi:hypothetical protein
VPGLSRIGIGLAGAAAGLEVKAGPIPLLSSHGILLLIAVPGAIGLWLAMAGRR